MQMCFNEYKNTLIDIIIIVIMKRRGDELLKLQQTDIEDNLHPAGLGPACGRQAGDLLIKSQFRASVSPYLSNTYKTLM